MTISSRGSKLAGIEIQRPVIILGMARSGTSIVSSIFREHGLWCGTVRKDRPSNYPTGQHENLRVKKELISRYGRVEDIKQPVPYDKTWFGFVSKFLIEDKYSGGGWFVKHSAFYGRVWLDLNPYYIFLARDSIEILDSIERKAQKKVDHAFWMDIIQKHVYEMSEMQELYGGITINSNLLIQGKYFQLKKAFEYCELELDTEKADKIIQPKIWGVTV